MLSGMVEAQRLVAVLRAHVESLAEARRRLEDTLTAPGKFVAPVESQRLAAVLRAHVETLAEARRRLEGTLARLDEPTRVPEWTAALASTRLGISQARKATAATLARSRNVVEVVNERCPKCGLHILGPRDMKARAMLHERICPGGNRRGENWFPSVRRADVRQPVPMLRLIRGGGRR
jgi:hypothetical protein